ncbi:hypothetical protein D3C72_850980 [compost metagenome]
MSIKKKQEEKDTEYPIIYTYIYEREGQDIKRLSRAYKNVRPKKHATAPKKKVIVRIQIVDGVPKPIYKDSTTQKAIKEIVPKKKASMKKTEVKGKGSPKK